MRKEKKMSIYKKKINLFKEFKLSYDESSNDNLCICNSISNNEFGVCYQPQKELEKCMGMRYFMLIEFKEKDLDIVKRKIKELRSIIDTHNKVH